MSVARFHFRLQTVLETRMRREDAEKRQLAAVESLLDRERRELDREQSRLQMSRRCLEDARSAEVDMAKTLFYYQYCERLKRDISARSSRIEGLRQQADQQREKVAIAMKERKVVERLRDKMLEEYRLEELRQEQAQIDEIATIRSSRNGARLARDLVELSGLSEAGLRSGPARSELRGQRPSEAFASSLAPGTA